MRWRPLHSLRNLFRHRPHPAGILALGLAVALLGASHVAPPVGTGRATPDWPPLSIGGASCPIEARPGRHADGWLLPPVHHVTPYDLLLSGYPETPARAHDLVLPITCTAYSSTHDQTDSTPFLTASMKPVQAGFIALSRDLLRRYTPGAPLDFGDRVELVGVGVFQVEDTMHHRWKRRADIWVASRDEARRWGRQDLLLARLRPIAPATTAAALDLAVTGAPAIPPTTTARRGS